MDPESGAVAFFDGHLSGRHTGLFRWAMKPTYQESSPHRQVLLEAVYIRAGTTPPPQRDIESLERYVERGLRRRAMAEFRSEIFYTGYLQRVAVGEDGDLYFDLSAQQRDRPVRMSPAKGKLFYLGVSGRRPSGWEDDAAEMGLLQREDTPEPPEEPEGGTGGTGGWVSF